MRVVTKIQGGLAVDPRTNAYFNEGETLAVGDKGLSKENLERLIELDLAEELLDLNTVASNVTKVVETKTEAVITPSEPSYKDFVKPAELRKFAEEKHGIILNKKLGLADMVEQFENELEGDL